MANDMTIKDTDDEIGAGTMVLSVDSSKRSPSVILKNSGVTIVGNNPAIGVNVDDSGMSMQGNIVFSSSGKNIVKGIYSENAKSAKPYTYTETVNVEASAKEAAYTVLAQQGVDISSLTEKGMIPLVTNISFGPVPHLHTMMFQHVHKIEPAYLYRMPSILTAFKETSKSFQRFLARPGGR